MGRVVCVGSAAAAPCLNSYSLFTMIDTLTPEKRDKLTWCIVRLPDNTPRDFLYLWAWVQVSPFVN